MKIFRLKIPVLHGLGPVLQSLGRVCVGELSRVGRELKAPGSAGAGRGSTHCRGDTAPMRRAASALGLLLHSQPEKGSVPPASRSQLLVATAST